MIEIKSFFGDWKQVDKEQAKIFISTMLDGSNMQKAKVIKEIESKHLRGITVKELLEEI